jgi:hypothetical protein
VEEKTRGKGGAGGNRVGFPPQSERSDWRGTGRAGPRWTDRDSGRGRWPPPWRRGGGRTASGSAGTAEGGEGRGAPASAGGPDASGAPRAGGRRAKGSTVAPRSQPAGPATAVPLARRVTAGAVAGRQARARRAKLAVPSSFAFATAMTARAVPTATRVTGPTVAPRTASGMPAAHAPRPPAKLTLCGAERGAARRGRGRGAGERQRRASSGGLRRRAVGVPRSERSATGVHGAMAHGVHYRRRQRATPLCRVDGSKVGSLGVGPESFLLQRRGGLSLLLGGRGWFVVGQSVRRCYAGGERRGFRRSAILS